MELTSQDFALSGGIAQGVQCGPIALAFPYGWTRAVVDEFVVTPVPRAPHWLVGASSVGGTVTPIIDLAAFVGQPPISRHSASQAGGGRERLLVGGRADAEANLSFALIFVGLPMQIERKQGDQSVPANTVALTRIRGALTGETAQVGSTCFHFVAPEALYDLISSQLAGETAH